VFHTIFVPVEELKTVLTFVSVYDAGTDISYLRVLVFQEMPPVPAEVLNKVLTSVSPYGKGEGGKTTFNLLVPAFHCKPVPVEVDKTVLKLLSP
jgi:hypothetical protein